MTCRTNEIKVIGQQFDIDEMSTSQWTSGAWNRVFFFV